MALKKCKECGHEVSSTANVCPNCGARQGRKKYGLGALIILIIVVGFIWALISNSLNSPTNEQTKRSPSTSTSNSNSNWYVLNNNSPGCYSKEDGKIAVDDLKQNDMHALMRLLLKGACINVPKGTKVSVLERYPMDGVAKIREAGSNTVLWVVDAVLLKQ
ncbi:MAG: zinc-ribbon domain-containing protein [Gammaproteobacteria bacterium]